MLNLRTIFTLLFLFIVLSKNSVLGSQVTDSSSVDSDSLNKSKVVLAASTIGTLYAGSMIGLYSLWYKDFPQSQFHFINDNQEWQQMDKFGHFTTSYYIGKICYGSLRWAGVKNKKAIWYGGLTGLVYLSTVEAMDGFSKQWGASLGDMAANTIGTALFIGQQLAWNEQKIILKYSFHGSTYSNYNPDQLGNTLPERMLKDYNGQTYWLSANISSLGLQHSKCPKWLNIAVGYGADGMVGADFNPKFINGIAIPERERLRQFYISPDIDLSRIPTKSKTLKLILNTIGFIKIPMPTLEFNKNGVKFRPLYF